MNEIQGIGLPPLRTQVPSISDHVIQEICTNYFGLRPERIKQLNGYDDKNYHLTGVTCLRTNPYVDRAVEDGYVLKITNTEDTHSQEIEGQNALLNHLKLKGLPVSELVKSKQGCDLIRIFVNYGTNDKEKKEGSVHAIRLLHFIPGQLLCHVTAGAAIIHKAGGLLARVHIALEDFRHSSFENPSSSPWSLNNIHYVKSTVPAVDDEERRELVMKVVDLFEKTVIPEINCLQTGQIHGDFNEQNLLVGQNGANEFDLCGILDMGDSHRGCLIFDVAISIVYMTLISPEKMPVIDVGGHFLAGYLAERSIPLNELRLLKICICARYCQSLVFGLYSYLQNPAIENDYVLITQKKGWTQLSILWHTPDEDLYSSWRRVMSMYGMRDILANN